MTKNIPSFRSDEDILTKSFYLLVMEDVRDRYFQNGTLNRNQILELLKSLSRFHAKFWKSNDAHNEEERGSFWVLNRRKPLGGRNAL